MTRSTKQRSTLELGHDSFLDIVANLVGILIILVVILGTQSQAVIDHVERESQQRESAEPQVAVASQQQIDRLSQHAMRAQSAQSDSDRFEKKIKEMDQIIAIRDKQRGQLLDLLSEAKAAWEDAKTKIDEKKAQMAAHQTELKKLQSELAKLEGEKERLSDQEEPVVAVEHLPTPMAKTVFGDEVHFRLKNNRLSVVPIEQLLSEIRRDFKRVASGGRDGRLEAAVGPMRGYVARYVMDKSNELSSSGGRFGTATRIQLVRMTVEPLQEPYGEPIQGVLQNGDVIDIELAGRSIGNTTITVWVYPDSFAAFRKLKENLYAKGYATAARPLPMDRAISGGPQGSRSRAQ